MSVCTNRVEFELIASSVSTEKKLAYITKHFLIVANYSETPNYILVQRRVPPWLLGSVEQGQGSLLSLPARDVETKQRTFGIGLHGLPRGHTG